MLFKAFDNAVGKYFENRHLLFLHCRFQRQGLVEYGHILHLVDDGAHEFSTNGSPCAVLDDGYGAVLQVVSFEVKQQVLHGGENAVVVGTPSEKYAHGSNATLCLSIKEDSLAYDELIAILDDIKRECNKKLQPRDRAKYYIITKKLFQVIYHIFPSNSICIS